MFKRLLNDSKKTIQLDSQSSGLRVEPLEERLMLSTVEVFAAGETGRESFFVLLDGQVVEEVNGVGGDFERREFERFSFDLGRNVTADRISIQFFNDTSDRQGDNNLFVDRIVVDGRTFQTEAPTTFHTGLLSGRQTIGPGFLETEVLNINGTVSFLARDAQNPPPVQVVDTGTRIRIDATGQTGEENLQLLIDGRAVQDFRFDAANREQAFFFSSDQVIDPSRIQIAFTNDSFDQRSGADRNLFVRSIQFIDRTSGQRDQFFTTDSRVFSDNSFVEAENVSRSGFGLGGALVTTGFISIDPSNVVAPPVVNPPVVNPPAADVGTRIRVDATGQTGEEILQLQIDGRAVQDFTFDAANREQAFIFTSDEVIDPSRIRIAFVNDSFDQRSGADRNLFVRSIQFIDRTSGQRDQFFTTDSTVFSDNSFVEAENVSRSGFGLGGALVTTGFISIDQSNVVAPPVVNPPVVNPPVAAVTTIRVDTVGSTGEEKFEVLVDGNVVGEFQAGTTAGAEFIDIPGDVNLSQVQVRFVNDLTDGRDFDRNLTVLGFQTINRTTGERVIARGSDANVLSTGTFTRADGVVDGFGRGITLTNNGFFQFIPDRV